MKSSADIYLADLTHTGQVVASNVMPLGIGLLASYLLDQSPELKVELFKYPEDLALALEKHTPKVVGFANYSWNLDISYEFTRIIKEKSPSTVIIFGGPNYGLSDGELQNFWHRYPLIDFYVVKEGEEALFNLITNLNQHDFDPIATKLSPKTLYNCHYLSDGLLIQNETYPRIKTLDQIGSPYLMGLMDKFFDGTLIPMIHTTRGCPFSCTFCTEGNSYYNKVSKRVEIHEELEYIAVRRGRVPDIVITDANFGMFAEDRTKALQIREIQLKYDWPKRIIVSTGKNQKEKIVEVANILDGSMNVAASLQSTDEEVLANIKRSNISVDSLRVIVEKSKSSDSVTYTEIILGLPGDTFEKHVTSLSDVTNSGLGVVRMYQLIMLPQTELNTPETRAKFGMETRFRVNPRSFGSYQVYGKQFVSVEHEEILIANNSLTFEDYLNCRELDLTVEIFHNSGMFYEVMGLCQWIGISWWNLIHGVYKNQIRRDPGISDLYDSFRADNLVGLHVTQDELKRHVVENIDTYLNQLDGTNEIAKGKAVAFFTLMPNLHEILYREFQSILTEAKSAHRIPSPFLTELKDFSLSRKNSLMDTELMFESKYNFDFRVLDSVGFSLDPSLHQFDNPVQFEIRHSEQERDLVESYKAQYGSDSIDSLGRILMRSNVRRLFRSYQCGTGKDQIKSVENRQRPDQTINVYGGFSVQ